MSKARNSVSGMELANSLQYRSMANVQSRQRGELPQQTRNDHDSGFIELTREGEGVLSNTNLSFGKYYTDSEMQAKQTIGADDTDVSSAEDSSSDSDTSAVDMATTISHQDEHGPMSCDSELSMAYSLSDTSAVDMATAISHQEQYSTCPSKVREPYPVPNDSELSMAYSLSEYTEIKESNMDDEEKTITAERVQRVSCPPQPLPHFVIVRPPRPSTIMLKWPVSYGRFLRVKEHNNRPNIIVDNYCKEFKRQYCLNAETEVVIDIDDNCHYLMCFRYEMYGKSFYLVPESMSSTSPETLKLEFDEADRNVVMEPLSDTNSKFWFIYKIYPFPVLASLSHPKYYLSLEKGYKVLLRKIQGRQPDTSNFNIQIIDVVQSNVISSSGIRFSLLKTLRKAVTSLACTK